MITKNIISVGIELEGYLNSNELTKIRQYIKDNNLTEFFGITTDDSLRVEQTNKDIAREFRFYNKNKKILLDFVKMCFKNGFIQNERCGNHLHFRFKNMGRALSLFGFKKIWNLLETYYKNFSYTFGLERRNTYLNRLNGRWCKNEYDETELSKFCLSKYNHLSRYKMINLLSYSQHNTIEFRLLPFFKSFREAKKSINWLINTIDKLYSLNNTKVIQKHYYPLRDTTPKTTIYNTHYLETDDFQKTRIQDTINSKCVVKLKRKNVKRKHIITLKNIEIKKILATKKHKVNIKQFLKNVHFSQNDLIENLLNNTLRYVLNSDIKALSYMGFTSKTKTQLTKHLNKEYNKNDVKEFIQLLNIYDRYHNINFKILANFGISYANILSFVKNNWKHNRVCVLNV